MRNGVFDLRFQFPVGFFKAIGLENTIPAEVPRPSRLNNGSGGLPDKKKRFSVFFMLVSQDCLGRCPIVFESGSHDCEFLRAEFI